MEFICFGFFNGSVIVMVSGGIFDYVYQWSIGDIGVILFGIIVGMYIFIVIDVFNQSIISSVIVNQFDLVIVMLIVDELCNVFFDIMVNFGGGIVFYGYNWSIGVMI